MNLRQLKYYVGIVEAGNMTRAAEQLHVAQTALSMQIRHLEEALGVALLSRHSRGVVPTAAGALLHQRAVEILALVERTADEVRRSGKSETEAIKLGTTPALMPEIGAELAIHVRDHLPLVMLSLFEAMSHVLIDQLIRAELDFILCYDVPDHPGIGRTALLKDDLVFVTVPSGKSGRPIPLVEALDEILAMPEEGDSVRNSVSRTACELGLELSVKYEVRSISAMKALTARGAASCILPYASVIDDVRSGRFDARPITMPPIPRTLFLAHSHQRGPFEHEVGLTGAVRHCLRPLIDELGPLCQPLWSVTS